jgi:hypothetical protein
MIVKIQRSIFPGDSSLLIYDKDKSVVLEVPMEAVPPSMRLAKGTKAFFYAELTKERRLVVGEQVDDQPW